MVILIIGLRTIDYTKFRIYNKSDYQSYFPYVINVHNKYFKIKDLNDIGFLVNIKML